MKFWFWVFLEILVWTVTCLVIYFFPEDAFAKGLIGFALLYAIDECKDINKEEQE